MSVSQSLSERRSVSAPAASPWTTTEKRRPARCRGYGQPLSSSAFASSAFLPWVDVGSGLPPSAQTEAIHHQLEHARRLVPVHRRDDHHAVRRHPARVDLVHPVAGLAQRVVRVAPAGPMAERHRRRDASLARMDARGRTRTVMQAEVEQIAPRCPRLRRPRAPASTSRKVFDISPGQVWSLRGRPAISRMRERLAGSCCRRSASMIRSRASSHSTGSSNSGSANPAPARRVRGLLSVLLVVVPGDVEHLRQFQRHRFERRILEVRAKAPIEFLSRQLDVALPFPDTYLHRRPPRESTQTPRNRVPRRSG